MREDMIILGVLKLCTGQYKTGRAENRLHLTNSNRPLRIRRRAELYSLMTGGQTGKPANIKCLTSRIIEAA